MMCAWVVEAGADILTHFPPQELLSGCEHWGASDWVGCSQGWAHPCSVGQLWVARNRETRGFLWVDCRTQVHQALEGTLGGPSSWASWILDSSQCSLSRTQFFFLAAGLRAARGSWATERPCPLFIAQPVTSSHLKEDWALLGSVLAPF